MVVEDQRYKNLWGKLIVPIFNLYIPTQSYSITNSFSISTVDQSFFDLFANYLSKDDYESIQETSHCIIIEAETSSDLSEDEVINMFLIACWIAKPTQVQIKFKFRFNKFSTAQNASQSITYFSRIHDLFQYNEFEIRNDIRLMDLNTLRKVTHIFSVLLKISNQKGNIYSCLHFMVAGCQAYRWTVAFVCYAVVMESLLYSSRNDSTINLLKAYACLASHNDKARDKYYFAFKRLYDLRSRILHGNLYDIDFDDKQSLISLAELSKLLRRLWRRICYSSDYQINLDFKAEKRYKWIKNMIKDYKPSSLTAKSPLT